MSRLATLPILAAALVATATCATSVGSEFQADVPVEFPRPEAVDAVVFLIGDAGAAEFETSPTLRRLKSDVEFWSENLAVDSAVTVLFLGDNVYPSGVHDRGHPSFPQDSSRLWSQIRVLEGPFARDRGSAGLFLAGNHDWGNLSGPRGLDRLQNQAAMLDSARTRGLHVRMVPEPGDPGPVFRDVRENVRLLLMDTHWFLQESLTANRSDFFTRVYQAMEDAEDRHVIMVAHHPYQSAGPHGLLAPGARALGLLYLMRKTGTLVQDLNSPIYNRFLDRMHETFRALDRAPLIFAAGHDHSLQVLDPTTPEGPRTVLVSGAGSKLTDLAASPLLRYAATKPGYMTLIFRANQAVDLYVFAGDETEGLIVRGEEEPEPVCEEVPEGEREFCAERHAAAVNLVYSERLAPPASLPDTVGIPPDTGSAVADTGAAPPDTGRFRSREPGRTR